MDLLNSSHLPAGQSELSSPFTQQLLPPLYLLVCVVGVVLNGPAAWLLLHVPSERPLVVYLKNMVGADLLLLSTLPLKVGAELGLGGRGLHVAVCRYSAVLFYSSMYVGIVFMGLISLDRYITITRHASSSSSPLHRVGVARVLALVTWCLLLFSVLPNAVLTSRSSHPNSSVSCMALKTPLGLQWHRVSSLCSVALFWAMLLLLCFCYSSIARRIYRSSRRERGGGACRRSGRSIFILLLVFLLCFVPYHACRVPYTLSQIPGARYSAHTRYVLFQLKEVTLLLSSANVCLDPLIYFFMCRSFRDSLLRKISGGGGRRRGGGREDRGERGTEEERREERKEEERKG
ncbi:P2Y purinoceptor 14 [Merluccius polli]|uniref:P2Y purinoceptor 14 n=1 Tax=Merluccius polli TaxID=89951 RepID=A0AA47MXU5_MERPO|nr:P2Y purinoceptor 14 [Merluccius polli]